MRAGKQNNLMDWMDLAKHLGGIRNKSSFRGRTGSKREEEAWEIRHLRDVGGDENYLIEFLCISLGHSSSSFLFLLSRSRKKNSKNKFLLWLFFPFESIRKEERQKFSFRPIQKGKGKERTTKEERKTNKVSFYVVWTGERGEWQWGCGKKLF